MFALNLSCEFVNAGECCVCGVLIAMPKSVHAHRLNDHKIFHCINGHPQIYAGKSEAEKLREQLELVTRQRDAANARETVANNSVRAYKGKLTEIKNRVGNGVCPCCKRSFTNLRRHMGTKHPDFKHESA